MTRSGTELTRNASQQHTVSSNSRSATRAAGTFCISLTGVAVAAAGIAKFLFFIFLVACLIFYIISMTAGRRTP